MQGGAELHQRVGSGEKADAKRTVCAPEFVLEQCGGAKASFVGNLFQGKPFYGLILHIQGQPGVEFYGMQGLFISFGRGDFPGISGRFQTFLRAQPFRPFHPDGIETDGYGEQRIGGEPAHDASFDGGSHIIKFSLGGKGKFICAEAGGCALKQFSRAGVNGMEVVYSVAVGCEPDEAVRFENAVDFGMSRGEQRLPVRQTVDAEAFFRDAARIKVAAYPYRLHRLQPCGGLIFLEGNSLARRNQLDRCLPVFVVLHHGMHGRDLARCRVEDACLDGITFELAVVPEIFQPGERFHGEE